MILMPGKDNFSKRFNWLRWSASIYETPEELLEAVKNSHCFGKRLAKVRVLGQSLPMFYSDRATDPWLRLGHVNCIEASEPVVFDFTDGSSVAFLPQRDGMSRMGFSSIPAEMVDGISKTTHVADMVFNEAFQSFWEYGRWTNLEIRTITPNVIRQAASPRVSSVDYYEPRVCYRFVFETGGCFDITTDFNGSSFFIGYAASRHVRVHESVPLDQLTNRLQTLFPRPYKDIAWETKGFGSSIDIFPDCSDTPNSREALGEARFKRLDFVRRHVRLAVDEDCVPAVLYRLWQTFSEPNFPFEHCGTNDYSFERMRALIAELKTYLHRLVHDDALAEREREAIFLWANCSLRGKVQSNHEEARQLLIDFLDRYCEMVEEMMDEALGFDTICVQGP